MRPLSGGVLLAALVVTSPALWRSLVEGTMPIDVALTRFLIAVGVCWLAVSIVADLAFPDPSRERVRVRTDEQPKDRAEG